MKRLTIPDVRVDEHTTRRTFIDGDAVREHAMEFYWRLKSIEDILGGGYDLDPLRKLIQAEQDGRLVVLPPPAKYGEPKPECFYNDCAGIWCLGYSHNGDDEPTERCKQCWYCQDGDYADDSEEAKAALEAQKGGGA